MMTENHFIKKTVVGLLLSVVGLAHPLVATSPDDFTKIGIGARAIAMGKSMSAMTEDTYSQYWNPAGLALINKKEVVSMGAKSLNVVDNVFVGFSMPLVSGTGLALGYTRSGLGGFKQTNAQGVDSGSRFSFEGTSMVAAIGTVFPLIPFSTVGLSIKSVSQSLGDASGSGITTTFGFMKALSSELRLGIVAENALQYRMNWDDRAEDDFEATYRVGLGWMPDAWTVTGEWQYRPENGEGTYAAGLEYHLDINSSQLAVRGGWDTLSQWSVGLGLTLSQLTLDYAYVTAPEDYADSSHFVSFKYSF